MATDQTGPHASDPEAAEDAAADHTILQVQGSLRQLSRAGVHVGYHVVSTRLHSRVLSEARLLRSGRQCWYVCMRCAVVCSHDTLYSNPNNRKRILFLCAGIRCQSLARKANVTMR